MNKMNKNLGFFDRLHQMGMQKKLFCRVCQTQILHPEAGLVVWEEKCANPSLQYSWAHRDCLATLKAIPVTPMKEQRGRGVLAGTWGMERFFRTDAEVGHQYLPWRWRVERCLKRAWPKYTAPQEEGDNTFAVWIRRQQKRQGPIGDLARDISRPVLPNERPQPAPTQASEADYEAWHSYLWRATACNGALDALDTAYLEFAKSIKFLLSNYPLNRQDPEEEEEEGNNKERIQVIASPTITLTLRFEIFKRDGYRCRLCGVAAKDNEAVRLEVDHITPRRKGGTDDPLNLWCLCFACNRGKGTKEL